MKFFQIDFKLKGDVRTEFVKASSSVDAVKALYGKLGRDKMKYFSLVKIKTLVTWGAV
jgi:hypothetical protein